MTTFPQPWRGFWGGFRRQNLSKHEDVSTLSAAFPAKAWIQMIDPDLCVRVWAPAFAGNTDVGRKNKALTQPSPSGRGLRTIKPSPPWGRGLGEGVSRASLVA